MPDRMKADAVAAELLTLAREKGVEYVMFHVEIGGVHVMLADSSAKHSPEAKPADKVKAIGREIAAYKDEVSKLEKDLYKAQCDLCGIHSGDIVEKDGAEFLVVRASNFWNDQPWVTVRKKRKDGQWADREQTLYSGWKKKENSFDAT